MRSVGCVPTMGAFHNGHLELMRRSVAECDWTCVTLFVNPTQFNSAEDFANYPRDEERDLALAESVGVDAVFMPTSEEMYGAGELTTVHVPSVTDGLEGLYRPGHFDGVSTVVCKLFHVIDPDRAYFGLKDLQQCAVIRKMVADLDMPVTLEFTETVREPSGLAMSSRNERLDPSTRSRASSIYRALEAAALQLTAGALTGKGWVKEVENKLGEVGLRLEYVALIDSDTMQEIERPNSRSRLVLAAWAGTVRLIDNIPVPFVQTARTD